MLTRLRFSPMLMACAVGIAAASRSHIATAQPDNAAIWYERAIAEFENAPPDEWDDVFNWDYDSTPPTPEVRAALAKARPILELMRRGAQQPYSDFQLDYSKGPELLLPHVGRMRSLTKLLAADAMLQLADGHSDAAADRINTTIRMSGHLAGDRTVISSLVGTAIYSLSDRMLQSAIDRGQLDGHAAASLLRATQSLDSRDPFGTIESVGMEQIVFGEWLERTFYEDGGREKVLGLLSELPDDDESGFAHAIRTMSDSEFESQMQMYYSVMDRFAEAFNQEDESAARAILDEIDRQLENGELGDLCTGMIPAFDKVYETLLKSRAKINDRAELLEKLSRGEVDPQKLENAALWYMRAGDMIEKLEGPWAEALDQFDVDGEWKRDPGDESLRALDDALESINPAMKEIVAGSEKRRCDFDYLTSNSTSLIPGYLVDMQNILRLLEIDVRRRLARDGDQDRRAALNELSTYLRVVAHLSNDRSLLGSRVAHDAFNRAVSLLESNFYAQQTEDDGVSAATPDPVSLDERQYRLLHGSMQWISGLDPFGYLASKVTTSERIHFNVYLLSVPSENNDAALSRKDAERFVRSCDGDELTTLLALATWFDADRKLLDASPAALQSAAETFAQYDLPTFLEHVRLFAGTYKERLEAGTEPYLLPEWEERPLAFESNQRRARRDVREAMRRLESRRPSHADQPGESGRNPEPEATAHDNAGETESAGGHPDHR